MVSRECGTTAGAEVVIGIIVAENQGSQGIAQGEAAGPRLHILHLVECTEVHTPRWIVQPPRHAAGEPAIRKAHSSINVNRGEVDAWMSSAISPHTDPYFFVSWV